MKDRCEVWNEETGENDGCEDPCGEALGKPVDFPWPALDAAERDEVRGRCKAADPVIDDADEWIWSHVASFG